MQICGECGKGFYRKDHLRKHAKSHALKRQKEINAQAVAAGLVPPPNVVPEVKANSPPKTKKKKAAAAAAAVAAAAILNNGATTSSGMVGESGATTGNSVPLFEIPISICPTSSAVSTATVNLPRTINAGNTTIIHVS